MTDDMMTLRAALENNSDADLLREMIGFAAQRLMELEVEQRIPKLRKGSYFPCFLEPRRMAEKALTAVIQEAYIQGISTRSVDDLVKAMGEAGTSPRFHARAMLSQHFNDLLSGKTAQPHGSPPLNEPNYCNGLKCVEQLRADQHPSNIISASSASRAVGRLL